MTLSVLTRVLAWGAVFLVPLAAAGVPLPYGVFALVPALAVADGVTSGRALRWAAFAFAFALVYRVPLGTLSLPVLAVAAIDAGIRRSARLNGESGRVSLVARRSLQGVSWVAGLVLASAVADRLLYGTSFSFAHVAALWLRLPTGGLVAVGTFVLTVLLLRSAYRARTERAW